MKCWFLLLLGLPLPCCMFAQTITTIAGNGLTGNTGDGSSAASAKIDYPVGGVFDRGGNYYFATSSTGNSVRKITPTGVIYTVAGTGIAGFGGDNGPATSAQLERPQAIAVDPFDNLYIADAGNNRIRKVNASDGKISTFAGNGSGVYNGDGILAINASIFNPLDICFDKFGNLFIADYGNARVRKVNVAGIITTVVGTGILFNSPGGGKADTTAILSPSGLCINDDGLYVANWHSRVYQVDTFGFIRTVVGDGTSGSSGDGGMATNAKCAPHKITIDKTGNLYIADRDFQKVRMVNKTGIIYTVAGNGVASYSGDGGLATDAQLNHPSGVALDTCGNLYFPDAHNYRIRKISFNPECWPVETPDVRKSDENVIIYPNPAHNELTITAPEEIKSVSVVDMVGRETSPGLSEGEVSLPVRQTGSNERSVRIDVSHLPAGVYVVRVNGVYFRRFVKE